MEILKFINKLKENKSLILIILLILFGAFIRIALIDKIPNALNVDEVSAGYEAYSVLNYGIDRNGNFLPVHFVAWGSGQNVLYSYLMMPFILIFGLNVVSIRLPMALIGSLALFLFYKLIKNVENKKVAIIGLAFLAICPWHIMKSRWGLESNILPELILLSSFILIKYIKTKNNKLLYLFAGVLGISTYAYGTSYFFVPVFLGISSIYLLYKKNIKINDAIKVILITSIIALPLIIFTIINTFNLSQINLSFMTIPRLTANRYQEVSSVFSGDFLKNSLNNFIESIKILLFQNDKLDWNALKWYGICYVFSIPFMILGIFVNFRKNENNISKNIINIWFVSSLLLMFVCEPNINRINVVMFPMIYYVVIGISKVIEKSVKILLVVLVLIYLYSFISFAIYYCNKDFDEMFVFEGGLQEVIEYVDSKDKKVYITNKIKEPYIYVLFYTKVSPVEFHKTVQYLTKGSNFEVVKSFGKYNFYIPSEMDENGVYVIKKDDIWNVNLDEFEVKDFGKYVVLE